MKKVLFGFIILIFLLLTFIILQLNTRVFPNTTLAERKISLKSTTDVKRLLEQMTKQPITIIVNNRSYQFSQKNLGISLNQNATIINQ